MTEGQEAIRRLSWLPGAQRSITALMLSLLPGLKPSDFKTVRSVGWSILGMGAEYFGSFALTLLVARPLGPSVYGYVPLVMGIVEMPRLLVVTTLGTSMAKHMSSLPTADAAGRKQVLKAGLYLILPFSLGLALLVFLLADESGLVLGMPELPALLRIGSLALLASGLTSFIQSAFRGADRLDILSQSQIAGMSVRVGLTLLLVYGLDSGAAGVLIGTGVSALFTGAVFLYVIWSKFWSRMPGNGHVPLADVASYAVPMVVGSLALFANTRIDVVLLGFFSRDPSELGFFGLATAVYAATLAVAEAVGSAIFPKTAGLCAEGRSRDLQHLFDMVIQGLLLYAVPASIAMFSLAYCFFDTVLPAYLPAALLLQILAPLVLLRSVNIVCTYGYLTPGGHAGDVARLTVVSATANVGMDLLLIPPFGAVGSVLGTLIVHGGSGLAAVYLMRRNMGIHLRVPWRTVIGGLAMAATICGATCTTTQSHFLHMTGSVLCGLVVFLLVVVLGEPARSRLMRPKQSGDRS